MEHTPIDPIPFSEAQLNGILQQFVTPAFSYSFKALTAGLINNTFLVSNTKEPKFILQRINTSIFKDTNGLMQNISQALITLTDKDYSRINLIPTKDHKNYITNASGTWRLMQYIKNSTTYNTTKNKNIAFEAGRIIGTFHHLLGAENTSSYCTTIPDFHNLELRVTQFKDAESNGTTLALNNAKDAIDFTKEMVPILQKMIPKNVKLRICHNDTKLNNILFDATSNKALCLIDLDTIMPGYFYNDFGDAIRTIVNSAPEDEQNHSKITFDKNIFRAFVDGLLNSDKKISSEELDALPFGVLLMPFLHGIRALTDYLNGNVYYQVKYENQNLDRALSLYHFTKKALQHKDFMHTVLTKKN